MAHFLYKKKKNCNIDRGLQYYAETRNTLRRFPCSFRSVMEIFKSPHLCRTVDLSRHTYTPFDRNIKKKIYALGIYGFALALQTDVNFILNQQEALSSITI